MADSLQFAQGILDSQPFSRAIGATVAAFGDGMAELVLTLRPDHLQQFGFVHSGVLSYLADNAITFAAGSILGEGVVTAEYKINYVRPAQGEMLIARAAVLHAGKRQAVCRCDIFIVQASD